MALDSNLLGLAWACDGRRDLWLRLKLKEKLEVGNDIKGSNYSQSQPLRVRLASTHLDETTVEGGMRLYTRHASGCNQPLITCRHHVHTCHIKQLRMCIYGCPKFSYVHLRFHTSSVWNLGWTWENLLSLYEFDRKWERKGCDLRHLQPFTIHRYQMRRSRGTGTRVLWSEDGWVEITQCIDYRLAFTGSKSWYWAVGSKVFCEHIVAIFISVFII